MQYFISFLEGIITFISPCLLPMLPVYVSYFSGGGQRETKKTVTNALGFILGFTLVFVALGALAGTFGQLLRDHQTAVNLVTGLIVVFFGLNFLGVFRGKPVPGRGPVYRGGAGLFLRPGVRHGVLHRLDPLRGGVFGLGPAAGRQPGPRAGRGPHALSLFPGAGHSLLPQRHSHRQGKGALGLIKRHYGVINRCAAGCWCWWGCSWPPASSAGF